MWIRMVSFAGAAAAVLVVLPGQLASQETTPLRERMFQSPTPAVLERLPGDRIETLTLPVIEPHIQMASPWKQDSETGASYRSGELLVKFKEGTGASTKAAALRSSGANRVMKVLPEAWELVEVTERTEAQDALVAMRTNDNVEAASLNYRATALQRRPNDEFFSMQWNFDTLQLPLAWEINAGASSAVTVAIVDTGLNTATDTLVFGTQFGQIATRFAAVPDLVNNTNIVRPYDFVWRDAFPVDFAGHGTHVAGTIAQTTNNNTGFAGVAYNVRIMPVKVLAEQGSWDDLLYPCPVGFIGCHRGGTYEVIAEGIRYAADSGAHVINLSLGGPAAAPIVRDAIRYAVGRGAFVAMAAGNSGDRGNPREYPAAYGTEIDGAMTVGAINRALRPAAYTAVHPYVEICAPGGETRFDYTDYEQGISQVGYHPTVTFSEASINQKVTALRLGLRPNFDSFIALALNGTSMAAPHVAGVAALLYSQGITNPAAIEEAIELFARPINATANECGAGLIDPRGTLRGLGLAR